MILVLELFYVGYIFILFCCGIDFMDYWLKQWVMKNQVIGVFCIFVCCDDVKVMVYYLLVFSVVMINIVLGCFCCNMFVLILVVVLGCLVVDKLLYGKGVGWVLVCDVGLCVIQVVEIIGICGMLVYVLLDEVWDFYLWVGFELLLMDLMMLMVMLRDLVNV